MINIFQDLDWRNEFLRDLVDQKKCIFWAATIEESLDKHVSETIE